MHIVALKFQPEGHLDIIQNSKTVFSGGIRAAADWLKERGFQYVLGTNGWWVSHGDH